jgi:hypothetical protein
VTARRIDATPEVRCRDTTASASRCCAADWSRRCARTSDDGAAELEAAVEDELAREARAFAALEREPGASSICLRLAAVLTHNAGDVMQGSPARTSRRARSPSASPTRAHGSARYRRRVRARRCTLYRALLASEGHRNYPLRGPRALRRLPELLLPIAPLLDDWGEARRAHARAIADASAPRWSRRSRRARPAAGQQGYYRALAGFARAHVARARRAGPRFALRRVDAPTAARRRSAPKARGARAVVRVTAREAGARDLAHPRGLDARRLEPRLAAIDLDAEAELARPAELRAQRDALLREASPSSFSRVRPFTLSPHVAPCLDVALEESSCAPRAGGGGTARGPASSRAASP